MLSIGELSKRTGVKVRDPNATLRNMSGGQRQCVAISRAANFARSLIIMDEPTAALGVQETAQVENIIRRLKEQGVPLILVSHNLRQVLDLVDKVWVFRHGRIVGTLDASEVSGNDIVAMINVDRAATERKMPIVWNMPHQPLYEALRTRARRRVLRADDRHEPLAASDRPNRVPTSERWQEVPGLPSAVWRRSRTRFREGAETALYYDLKLRGSG